MVRFARFLVLLSIALPFSIAALAVLPMEVRIPLRDAYRSGGWSWVVFLKDGSVGIFWVKPLPKPPNDQPLSPKEEIFFSRGGFLVFSGEFLEIGLTNIKRFERRFEIEAPRWLLCVAAIAAGVWGIRRAQRVARSERGFTVVTSVAQEPRLDRSQSASFTG